MGNEMALLTFRESGILKVMLQFEPRDRDDDVGSRL